VTVDTAEQQPTPPDLASLIANAAAHPDPWFSALAKSYLEQGPVDDDVDPTLAKRLAEQAAGGTYVAPEVIVENHLAPGPHGPVPVRVYLPYGETAGRPLLVWCHGGGFVGGDVDMPEADATGREVCSRAGAVVVSVDYRLATQGVHFPVPHDDVLAAYEWGVQHFGARERCVIGGGSAGANLAAGVALRLRDEGRAPTGVLLLYPLVHPELPVASDELAGKLAALTVEHAYRGRSTAPMIENYLGAPIAEATPYAMPGLGDLAGYPPTLVINCEYDPLRASGEAFVEELESAGVEVTQLLATDVLHGHINSPWLPQAQQSYADMASWLTAHS
jgi:acetyl esterase/lipase